jgi:catalase
VGIDGPILMQDTLFLEKISRLVNERIPERHVHAKGTTAKGYFVVTNPAIASYTKADLFSALGK